MALRLDFFVQQVANKELLVIADASSYPNDPPQVVNPTIEITPPGFDPVSFPFDTETYNTFTSDMLEITEPGVVSPLPDGIYTIKYSVDPPDDISVQKSYMRTEQIQEMFDEAFMTLDMMECDRAIKQQAIVELNSIYFFIQGSISAANNCALVQAQKLYTQAYKMLDRLTKAECGCNGSIYPYRYGSM